MHVKINNQDFTFSTGEHNELQKAIIEEFAPRFAPNSECLYVGDTIKKDLVKNEEKLLELSIGLIFVFHPAYFPFSENRVKHYSSAFSQCYFQLDLIHEKLISSILQ